MPAQIRHPCRIRLRCSASRGAIAKTLAVSTLGVSLLYLVSFLPVTSYLVHHSALASIHWQPYCLFYNPLAHACPRRILISYAMQCGLTDIEAFYLVECLRSEEIKHTTDPFAVHSD